MDCQNKYGMDGPFKSLQDHINKLTENQNTLMSKFDTLTKNVDVMQKIFSQFAEKISILDDIMGNKKKMKAEIKVLKNRIDELFAIVKEGKEDNYCSSDVPDVDSCHSGFSSSSKVSYTFCD